MTRPRPLLLPQFLVPLFLLSALLSLPAAAIAQSVQAIPAAPDAALDASALARLRSSLVVDAPFTAAMNAVTVTGVRTLAQNRATVITSDHAFSNRIPTQGVTDQKSSGRCWLFAGLNILRPVTGKATGSTGFEFSQNYLFFYDKLEKANLFLESIIQTRERPVEDKEVEWLLRNPFPDGGQWNMALALIEKYGVVPADVMPETESSANTGQMNAMLSTLLRSQAARLRAMHAAGSTESTLRAGKLDMLQAVYRLLAIHLGIPPESFTWRPKTKDGNAGAPERWTPRSFYEKYVGIRLSDYVCLHSVPVHPFNRMYQIQFDRNLVDAPNMTFLNLPFDRLRAYTLASVLANEPVWFGCDVGKESDSKLGIMRRGLFDYASLYGVSFDMSKADRVRYQESVPSHAMVITGVDVVGGVPVKWLVENSWGAKAGNNGMFAMYDDWFEEYTYSVIIHRRFLPAEVLSLLAQPAVVLPPWDPMFAVEPR